MGYIKVDPEEGGEKVYSVTGNQPNQTHHVSAINLTTVGDETAISVEKKAIVSGFKCVQSSVTAWTAGNGTLTLEHLTSGVALGAGTSIGTITVAQSGATEGVTDTSSDLSIVTIEAGDRLQVARSGNVSATAALVDVQIELTYIQ